MQTEFPDGDTALPIQVIITILSWRQHHEQLRQPRLVGLSSRKSHWQAVLCLLAYHRAVWLAQLLGLPEKARSRAGHISNRLITGSIVLMRPDPPRMCF